MRSLRPLRSIRALVTAVLLIGALATVPALAQKAALPASTAAAWQQKLDPGTRMLYNAATAASKRGTPLRAVDRIPYSLSTAADGRLMADLFVQLDSPSSVAVLEASGARVRAQVGDIVVVRVPLEALPLLAETPAVLKIEMSRRRHPLNDVGRVDIRADLVHQGTGLPQAYQGEGVVVGVIDSGIDFSHPDFSDADGSRIQYLLEFTDDGGSTMWTKSQIDADPGSVTQRDADGSGGHGSHVTGTAAGGGQLNPIYRGIAPKADIIFVKGIRDPDSDGGFDDADIVAGCQFIFDKAAEMGKPAVINLSLGGNGGPLDGSTLYEQALSTLTGPGRIIVAAGGNEGEDVIHAGTTIETEQTYETLLEVPDPGPAIIDLWYEPGTISRVSIGVYAIEMQTLQFLTRTDMIAVGETTGPPRPLVANGDTLGFFAIDAEATEDPNNGDGLVFFGIADSEDLFEDDPNRDISPFIFSIQWQGSLTSGQMDMWVRNGSFFDFAVGLPGVIEVPGDTDFTIGTPASAKKVISVGAYTTRSDWTDIDGNMFTTNAPLGARAGFSSMGPTRDGRTAPDISAPGNRIASVLSSHLTEGIGVIRSDMLPGGGYQLQQGTSQATPFVTGTVALMLQANPSLEVEDILEIF